MQKEYSNLKRAFNKELPEDLFNEDFFKFEKDVATRLHQEIFK